MASIAYTAKRKLVSGHTASTVYSFDIGLERLDASSKFTRTKHFSISGISETWLQKIDDFYELTTEPIDLSSSLIGYMREFLASVADGSAFVIDFDGTVAVPVSPNSYELDSDTYKEHRSGVRYISFPFKIRAV